MNYYYGLSQGMPDWVVIALGFYYVLLCLLVGFTAIQRHRSFARFVILSILVTPIVAYAMLVATPYGRTCHYCRKLAIREHDCSECNGPEQYYEEIHLSYQEAKKTIDAPYYYLNEKKWKKRFM